MAVSLIDVNCRTFLPKLISATVASRVLTGLFGDLRDNVNVPLASLFVFSKTLTKTAMKRQYTYLAIALSLLFAAPSAVRAQFDFGGGGGLPGLPSGLPTPPMPPGM